MPKSGIFFHLGTVGNFGQCQVYVLIHAAAKVESAWARGSQGIFCPAIARSTAGTTAVIFVAELHGGTTSPAYLTCHSAFPPALGQSLPSPRDDVVGNATSSPHKTLRRR